MFVPVSCAACYAVVAVDEEVLGNVTRCRSCGTEFLLHSPNGLPLPAGEPAPPAPEPAPEPRPVRPPRPARPAAPDRAAPKSKLPGPGRVLAVAAVLFLFAGCGLLAGGILLVRNLVDQPQQDEPGAAGVADEAGPAVAGGTPGSSPPPALAWVDPPLPVAVPPDPPRPVPATADGGKVIQFPGPVAAVVAGGGGRYLVFHVPSAGRVVVYNTSLGRTVGTIQGADETAVIAAGREKLFIGRATDARLTRWDLKTGRQEVISFQQRAEPLRYLAMGAASDGPLVMVTLENNRGEVAILDPLTCYDTPRPIDDTTYTFSKTIPYRYTSGSGRLLMPVPSADGRSIAIRDRALVRDGERFRGVRFPGPVPVLPATDGKTFLTYDVFSDRGEMLRPNGRPPAYLRRLIPATSGPLHVVVEQDRAGGPVRLTLHANNDPNPLGPLPGAALLTDWAAREPGSWLNKVDRHLFFAPDPGVLVFHPPGADRVVLYPVNLEAMLDTAGSGPLFVTTPPAEVVRGRKFEYQAVAVAKGGNPSYWPAGGPSGMYVSPTGQVSLPGTTTGTTPGSSFQMRVAARVGNQKQTIQSFQLLMSSPPKAPRKRPAGKQPVTPAGKPDTPSTRRTASSPRP